MCKIIAGLITGARLSLTRLEIVGEDAIREARRTRETRMYIGQLDRYRSRRVVRLTSFVFASLFHLPSAIRLIARSKPRRAAAYPRLLPQRRHFGDAAASQRET